jgi:menaquinone-dependent protoporphyrinogen IX oxidase
MRVAVVFFSGQSGDRVRDLARALGKGLERQGHQVDLVDGVHDTGAKLTIHQYIAVGAAPTGSFGGRIGDSVKNFLASGGAVSGKKSYAFVPKSTFGAAKALTALMRVMEGEGMFLKNSDILRSPAEAEEVGRRLHVG